jgi:hypothetical protein
MRADSHDIHIMRSLYTMSASSILQHATDCTWSVHLASTISMNDWIANRSSFRLYFINTHTHKESHSTESPGPADVTMHLSAAASERKRNDLGEIQRADRGESYIMMKFIGCILHRI